MKITMTSVVALLLMAGASSAALAQEGDHARVEQSGHPQAHPGTPGAVSQARRPMVGAPGAAPPMGGHVLRGHEAPFGAPPAPGARAGAPIPGSAFRSQDGRPGAPAVIGAPGPVQAQRAPDSPPHFIHNDAYDALRRNDGGGRNPAVPGERRWDRADRGGGPHEVILPPNSAPGGWDRNGRPAGDPNGPHDGRHGPPERWAQGRYPPVYWSQSRYRVAPYRAPYGFFVRSWVFGDFLPTAWYADQYWLDDFLDYGLPYPPPGFEWVRVGGDAMMIELYTGRIVQVVRGIFW
jgi:Ni/Co efflux regulator RcnB